MGGARPVKGIRRGWPSSIQFPATATHYYNHPCSFGVGQGLHCTGLLFTGSCPVCVPDCFCDCNRFRSTATAHSGILYLIAFHISTPTPSHRINCDIIGNPWSIRRRPGGLWLSLHCCVYDREIVLRRPPPLVHNWNVIISNKVQTESDANLVADDMSAGRE